MSKLSIASLLVLLACVSAPVYAVGKVTADPNAGRRESAGETAASADVAQKVTYEARRKTVVSILADLSEMTGVKLIAGYSSKDWQVRDRRMNIFAKDIPLASLMNSIARVMKFSWSKSEDDKTVSYRLFMDRNELLGAERQRYIEEQRLNQRQVDARQRLLSGLQKAAGMSETELEELKTSSPYVYLMAAQGWADILPRLFAESPAAKQAWISGEQLAIDIGSVSADVKSLLMKVLLIQNVPETASLLINTMRTEGGNQGNIDHIGDIGVGVPGHSSRCGFTDPDSEYGRLVGSSTLAMMEARTQEEMRATAKQFLDQRAQAQISDTTDLGEPLTEHPDDPTLSVKVKMEMKGDLFSDALAAVASCSSFAVVSDSFAGKYNGLSFPHDETELRAVLDKLGSTCHYNWERHDSTLEFRDRDWFRKRAAQIPDAWLEGWRKAYKDKGFLEISELSQIASLTPEQIWFNILTDDVLGYVCNYLPSSREFLMAYAGLSTKQRDLIFTAKGLRMSSLSDSQWPAMQALLRGSASPSETGDGLSLVGARTQVGRKVSYVFQVITSAGEATGAKWDVRCPRYDAPPKEKPKDNKPGESEAQKPKQASN